LNNIVQSIWIEISSKFGIPRIFPFSLLGGHICEYTYIGRNDPIWTIATYFQKKVYWYSPYLYAANPAKKNLLLIHLNYNFLETVGTFKRPLSDKDSLHSTKYLLWFPHQTRYSIPQFCNTLSRAIFLCISHYQTRDQ